MVTVAMVVVVVGSDVGAVVGIVGDVVVVTTVVVRVTTVATATPVITRTPTAPANHARPPLVSA